MASNAAVHKRRLQILETVRSRGIATVEELSASLGVSQITIRRDLDHLCGEGSLIRRHGGAVPAQPEDSVPERNLREKDVLNIEAKNRIAAAAVGLLENDEIIFMNSGSTTLCFLRALAGRRVKVITNNVASLSVPSSPGLELMILGGEYREQSQSLVGEFALSAIQNIWADHTFLGTNGLSLERGLTTSVYQECSVNQAMIDHTHGKVVVLADSSKMGKVANFISSPLSNVDIVVTDSECPEPFRRELEERGIQVILA
ncbi:MAG: DeoR/GlpR transcriptional regulator [Treponema sp.]|nr:DeoR/GlpR transcriptional regulator [Treponema sp.]